MLRAIRRLDVSLIGSQSDGSCNLLGKARAVTATPDQQDGELVFAEDSRFRPTLSAYAQEYCSDQPTDWVSTPARHRSRVDLNDLSDEEASNWIAKWSGCYGVVHLAIRQQVTCSKICSLANGDVSFVLSPSGNAASGAMRQAFST